METDTIRIGIQKSGRLTEKTLSLLKQSGLEFDLKRNVLFSICQTFPVEIMLVRDDDIPEYVTDGTCDLGFVGLNVLQEKMLKKKNRNEEVPVLLSMDYGKCRLSLAIKNDQEYTGLNYFSGKKIATSYPNITEKFLADNNIEATVIEISGSVEVTPKLNIADCICDIVSSGATLKGNDLKEVQRIMDSESVLIQTPKPISAEKQVIIERLLSRLKGVLMSQRNKYIMMNAEKSSLEAIKDILPGVETPSVMPLAGPGDKVAVHVVCQEHIFWETIEKLKLAGASSILVLPIEKYIS